jgi:tRNA dimethylallyltransferase
MTKNKLIVVLGPTACGKTKIATKLAKLVDGEIVSADSRQVYKGMDIGTGKDLVDYNINKKTIPYHLIDIIKPMTSFDVAKYQRLAYKAINNIVGRGKTPILVGGTGLYLDAVVKGYSFSKASPQAKEIRKRLTKLSLKQLLSRLKKIDPKTYRTIQKQNKRRVQRALEIYYESGIPKSKQAPNKKPPYDVLTIGIKFPLEKIYHKIDSRLEARIQEGMIKEVKKLRKSGVTWKKLDNFGLEYRWVSRYLRGIVDYQELVANLKNDIHHFAKRQLTWFKRNKDIKWVTNYNQAEKLAKKFLK